MTRIASLDPATSAGRARELLVSTQKQLGRTPNLYRSMAQSPVALEAYLAFRGVLANGGLSMKMMESIALFTAVENDCDYCVAAHSFRGAKIGMSEQELNLVRAGQAIDGKESAALRFVQILISKRGAISDSDFNALKQTGWNDAEIGEMIAHVALNMFSNYFNHVAKPELDFPRITQTAAV
ncbi:carboxymuconolactone decarboxylase family protein [Undibacterium sp. TJN19]|uniref:carboxymuconolactone decarboxylase family protein n=1 Tax=Undibacterium sp. TJN19 TaxID=3413055 RepID=UPI003BEF80CE